MTTTEWEISDAFRHRSRRCLPRLFATRPHRCRAVAERIAGRGPACPHPVARPLLTQGTPATLGAGGVPVEGGGGIHTNRHHLDRRPPCAPGVPGVGRRPMAVSL